MNSLPQNPIYVALDTVDVDRACALAEAVAPYVGGLKLGLEFCHANGPEGIRKVAAFGKPIFLDLKLKDIPNTVAGGIRAVLGLAPAIVNVHATGGRAMMEAAMKEARTSGDNRPLLIAVTALTSLDQDDLNDIGVTRSLSDHVVELAKLTQASGLDGVVCSAHEIEAIRSACGPDFKLIVPGIRPAGSDTGDQKRVMTPQDALAKGADILVIGRAITNAADPGQAAQEISASL